MSNNNDKEPNKIVMYAATVLITIILSMTGFWLMIGREFVTRAEAKEIAEARILLVDQRLEIYRRETVETRAVISKNSEVINDLRVELARLTQAIKNFDNINEKL